MIFTLLDFITTVSLVGYTYCMMNGLALAYLVPWASGSNLTNRIDSY